MDHLRDFPGGFVFRGGGGRGCSVIIRGKFGFQNGPH